MSLNALKSKAIFKAGALGDDSDHWGLLKVGGFCCCICYETRNLAFAVGGAGLFPALYIEPVHNLGTRPLS